MKLFIMLTIALISLCTANPPKTELRILPQIDGGSYIVHKIKGTEIRDGVEVDFYTDGKVKVITNYENGKVNGIWLRLNRDGSTCFKMQFINDTPIGAKLCANGASGDFYTMSCGCDE